MAAGRWTVLSVAAAAWTMVAAAGGAPPRVDLGAAVVAVSEVADVPLSLEANGEQITALRSEITFPSALSFAEAVAGAAGTTATVTVRAEERSTSDPANKQIVVTVETKDGKTIPDGSVAVVKFTAPKEVAGEDSADFTLPQRVVLTRRDRTSIEATGTPGLITVLKGPPEVAACFFYMH